MPEIELIHVTLEYPHRVTALHDICLSVPKGTFISLIGPSGSGKSSLLRIIAGLASPKEGDVRFDGQSVLGKKPQERNVAMIFQNLALYPHMTVYQNIAYPLVSRGYPKEIVREKAEETARMLGLSQLLEKRPRRLSGGQRQLTAIARALVRNPDIFLLDEPFSNLDEASRSMLRSQIRQAHERMPETTFVYAAHDQAEAFALSDRVALLREGRLVMYDTPGMLCTRPADLFAASFVGGGRMNLLRGELHGGQVLFGILPEDLSLAPGVSLECSHQDMSGKIVIIAVSDGLVRKGTEVIGAFSVPQGSCLIGRLPGMKTSGKYLFSDSRSMQYYTCISEDWPAAGTPVLLTVPEESVNIFDALSGKRA